MQPGGTPITTTAPPPPESPRIRAIKRAYLAGELPVGDIAREFRTTRRTINAMAWRYEWPLRRPGRAR